MDLSKLTKLSRGTARSGRLISAVCGLLQKHPHDFLAQQQTKRPTQHPPEAEAEAEAIEEKNDLKEEGQEGDEKDKKSINAEMEELLWKENAEVEALVSQLAPEVKAKLTIGAKPFKCPLAEIRRTALAELTPAQRVVEGKGKVKNKKSKGIRGRGMHENWMAAYKSKKRRRKQEQQEQKVRTLKRGESLNGSRLLEWKFMRVVEIRGWVVPFEKIRLMVEVRRGSHRKHVQIVAPWLEVMPHCDAQTRWPVRLKKPNFVIWDCVPPLNSFYYMSRVVPV